jgi:hypothetical protein
LICFENLLLEISNKTSLSYQTKFKMSARITTTKNTKKVVDPVKLAAKEAAKAEKLAAKEAAKAEKLAAKTTAKAQKKAEQDAEKEKKKRKKIFIKAVKAAAKIGERKQKLAAKENASSSQKRRESCKKVGGLKKAKGHQYERDFLRQYNPKDLDNPIEYGATSDTSIDINHPICELLKTNLSVDNFNVSNKSGKNIQLSLGNIPELSNIEADSLKDKQLIRNIFDKYLKKINSARPAGILAYNDNSKWIFFNMDDVVNFITEKCQLRKLPTGRLKGDFEDNSRKGYSQYLTYEYRDTHKSYFLGFNGNKGLPFINLLKNKIKYLEDNYISNSG